MTKPSNHPQKAPWYGIIKPDRRADPPPPLPKKPPPSNPPIKKK